MATRSAQTRIGQLTLQAHRRTTEGLPPADAWIAALKGNYTGEQLRNQLKHTCPKFAFVGLCHAGYVKGVTAGSSPEAENSSSASYALRGLAELRRSPSLADRKSDLRKVVFRDSESGNMRKPNGEVDVLLALWELGLIDLD